MKLPGAGILAGLLFLQGCELFTGCTYEQRSVKSSGIALENGFEAVHAEVVVGAVRGPLRYKTLELTLLGSELKGHILSVALVKSDNPTDRLVEIPLYQGATLPISSGSLNQRPGEESPNLGGLYEILAANRGTLNITTDLASRPRVLVTLRVTKKTDWFRPNNCY
ncbi:MAG: hypothetical protein WKF55_12600 [Gemmatimonadaceae bacterium]